MAKFAIVDAPGYCGDLARVYSTHQSIEEARKEARKAPGLVVIARGGLDVGETVRRVDVERYAAEAAAL